MWAGFASGDNKLHDIVFNALGHMQGQHFLAGLEDGVLAYLWRGGNLAGFSLVAGQSKDGGTRTAAWEGSGP